VVGLLSKEVPPEGDVFDGKFIPGGTKIGFSGFGMFHNPDFWGQDAEQFRLERWIECSVEELKEMDATLELVFAYGKYQCLGKNLAMMELNKIFVELLRNFDFGIVDPFKPVKSVCHGIFFQSEIWMCAFDREQ